MTFIGWEGVGLCSYLLIGFWHQDTANGDAARKAFLAAFLEPSDALAAAEASGDGFARLALFEEIQSLPAGAVWDELCERSGSPAGGAFAAEVGAYASSVLAGRA